MLFCHITSRVETDKHQNLLREKGGTGFPYLVFMDAEGNVLAKQGQRTVAAFEATVDRLAKRSALAKKAEAGDAAAKVDLAICDHELGSIDFAALQERTKGLSLTDAQKASIEQFGVEAEVASILNTARARPINPDSPNPMGEIPTKLKAMKEKGRIPKGNTATSFWVTLANAAITDGDKKAANEAYSELEKLAEKNPALKQRALPDLRKKIDALGG